MVTVKLCGNGRISLDNMGKAVYPPFCLTGFVQVLHNDAYKSCYELKIVRISNISIAWSVSIYLTFKGD